MSFLRRSTKTEPETAASTKQYAPKPGGKNRPTPKRRDAQPQRGGPAAAPPQTQREAFKRERTQAKDSHARGKSGLKSGDDKYLLNRDKGPVRAMTRDLVDARRNIGSLFLPFAVLIVVGTVIPNPVVQQFTFSLWTAALLLLVVDSVRISRYLMKTLRAKFGDDLAGDRRRSLLVYAISRATVMRRMRRPAPRVSPQ